jgi:hypothetical protein
VTGVAAIGGELAWEQSLDALEEWVRQVGSALRRGEVDAIPSAPELPGGPVPASHNVRALALQTHIADALAGGQQGRERLAQSAGFTAA